MKVKALTPKRYSETKKGAKTKNSKNDVITDVIMTSELLKVDSTLQCNTKLKFITFIKSKRY